MLSHFVQLQIKITVIKIKARQANKISTKALKKMFTLGT